MRQPSVNYDKRLVKQDLQKRRSSFPQNPRLNINNGGTQCEKRRDNNDLHIHKRNNKMLPGNGNNDKSTTNKEMIMYMKKNHCQVSLSTLFKRTISKWDAREKKLLKSGVSIQTNSTGAGEANWL